MLRKIIFEVARKFHVRDVKILIVETVPLNVLRLNLN